MFRPMLLLTFALVLTLNMVPTSSASWMDGCVFVDNPVLHRDSCFDGYGNGECNYNKLWPDCEQICVTIVVDPKVPYTYWAQTICVRGTNPRPS